MLSPHSLLASIAAIDDSPATNWDTPGVILLKLAAVLLLVLLNGFFVASEFAIVKVRASQLDALVADGNRLARVARNVVEHLDAYLSATQLGITLASLALGWIGEPFLAQMIEPLFALACVTAPAVIHGVSFALAFATMTILHIVLGELAPKSLAIRRAVPTTLLVSRPLKIFHGAFRPAIWALNGMANLLLKHLFRLEPVKEGEASHSEDELRLILDESARTSQISETSQEIVANAFDLRKRTVREVMAPRREVVFLDMNLSFRENLQRAKAARHTRFPLCEGNMDHIIGLIHIKDLLVQLDESEPRLLAIKKEMLAVPELMPLEKLLPLFRRRGTHLAAVFDEYGGSVGIVTLQHVIAELVGELPDEFGLETKEFERLGPDEFLVAGGLGLYELHDLAGIAWQNSDVTTVGGYVSHHFGQLPNAGDSMVLDGHLVTVEKADHRRVELVRFRRQTDADDLRTEARL